MRIEVKFGGAVARGDAVLVQEGFAPPAGAEIVVGFRAEGERKIGHGVGCLCCVTRGAVAVALTRLFLRRARGELPDFRRVVVVGDTNGTASVRAAVAGDVLLRARFYFEAEAGGVSGKTR